MPARRKPLEELAFRRPSRPPAALTVTKPALGIDPPDPPRGLRAEALAAWSRYWASDVAYAAQSSDLPAIERWAWMIHQWHDLFAAVTARPVVLGSMGQPVLSPVYAALRALESSIAGLEDRLGMNPKSRANLRLVFREEQLTAAHINAMAEQAGHARWEEEQRERGPLRLVEEG